MCCHHPNRREFIGLTTAGAALLPVTALSAAPSWDQDLWDPGRPFTTAAKPLRVQPILMYTVSTPKHATSWKSWGGVQSEQSAEEEAGRITGELKALASRAGFPIVVAPVVKVRSMRPSPPRAIPRPTSPSSIPPPAPAKLSAPVSPTKSRASSFCATAPARSITGMRR